MTLFRFFILISLLLISMSSYSVTYVEKGFYWSAGYGYKGSNALILAQEKCNDLEATSRCNSVTFNRVSSSGNNMYFNQVFTPPLDENGNQVGIGYSTQMSLSKYSCSLMETHEYDSCTLSFVPPCNDENSCYLEYLETCASGNVTSFTYLGGSNYSGSCSLEPPSSECIRTDNGNDISIYCPVGADFSDEFDIQNEVDGELKAQGCTVISVNEVSGQKTYSCPDGLRTVDFTNVPPDPIDPDPTDPDPTDPDPTDPDPTDPDPTDPDPTDPDPTDPDPTDPDPTDPDPTDPDPIDTDLLSISIDGLEAAIREGDTNIVDSINDNTNGDSENTSILKSSLDETNSLLSDIKDELITPDACSGLDCPQADFAENNYATVDEVHAVFFDSVKSSPIMSSFQNVNNLISFDQPSCPPLAFYLGWPIEADFSSSFHCELMIDYINPILFIIFKIIWLYAGFRIVASA